MALDTTRYRLFKEAHDNGDYEALNKLVKEERTEDIKEERNTRFKEALIKAGIADDNYLGNNLSQVEINSALKNRPDLTVNPVLYNKALNVHTALEDKIVDVGTTIENKRRLVGQKNVELTMNMNGGKEITYILGDGDTVKYSFDNGLTWNEGRGVTGDPFTSLDTVDRLKGIANPNKINRQKRFLNNYLTENGLDNTLDIDPYDKASKSLSYYYKDQFNKLDREGVNYQSNAYDDKDYDYSVNKADIDYEFYSPRKGYIQEYGFDATGRRKKVVLTTKDGINVFATMAKNPEINTNLTLLDHVNKAFMLDDYRAMETYKAYGLTDEQKDIAERIRTNDDSTFTSIIKRVASGGLNYFKGFNAFVASLQKDGKFLGYTDDQWIALSEQYRTDKEVNLNPMERIEDQIANEKALDKLMNASDLETIGSAVIDLFGMSAGVFADSFVFSDISGLGVGALTNKLFKNAANKNYIVFAAVTLATAFSQFTMDRIQYKKKYGKNPEGEDLAFMTAGDIIGGSLEALGVGYFLNTLKKFGITSKLFKLRSAKESMDKLKALGKGSAVLGLIKGVGAIEAGEALQEFIQEPIQDAFSEASYMTERELRSTYNDYESSVPYLRTAYTLDQLSKFKEHWLMRGVPAAGAGAVGAGVHSMPAMPFMIANTVNTYRKGRTLNSVNQQDNNTSYVEGEVVDTTASSGAVSSYLNNKLELTSETNVDEDLKNTQNNIEQYRQATKITGISLGALKRIKSHIVNMIMGSYQKYSSDKESLKKLAKFVYDNKDVFTDERTLVDFIHRSRLTASSNERINEDVKKAYEEHGVGNEGPVGIDPDEELGEGGKILFGIINNSGINESSSAHLSEDGTYIFNASELDRVKQAVAGLAESLGLTEKQKAALTYWVDRYNTAILNMANEATGGKKRKSGAGVHIEVMTDASEAYDVLTNPKYEGDTEARDKADRQLKRLITNQVAKIRSFIQGFTQLATNPTKEFTFYYGDKTTKSDNGEGSFTIFNTEGGLLKAQRTAEAIAKEAQSMLTMRYQAGKMSKDEYEAEMKSIKEQYSSIESIKKSILNVGSNTNSSSTARDAQKAAEEDINKEKESNTNSNEETSKQVNNEKEEKEEKPSEEDKASEEVDKYEESLKREQQRTETENDANSHANDNKEEAFRRQKVAFIQLYKSIEAFRSFFKAFKTVLDNVYKSNTQEFFESVYGTSTPEDFTREMRVMFIAFKQLVADGVTEDLAIEILTKDITDEAEKQTITEGVKAFYKEFVISKEEYDNIASEQKIKAPFRSILTQLTDILKELGKDVKSEDANLVFSIYGFFFLLDPNSTSTEEKEKYLKLALEGKTLEEKKEILNKVFTNLILLQRVTEQLRQAVSAFPIIKAKEILGSVVRELFGNDEGFNDVVTGLVGQGTKPISKCISEFQTTISKVRESLEIKEASDEEIEDNLGISKTTGETSEENGSEQEMDDDPSVDPNQTKSEATGRDQDQSFDRGTSNENRKTAKLHEIILNKSCKATLELLKKIRNKYSWFRNKYTNKNTYLKNFRIYERKHNKCKLVEHSWDYLKSQLPKRLVEHYNRVLDFFKNQLHPTFNFNNAEDMKKYLEQIQKNPAFNILYVPTVDTKTGNVIYEPNVNMIQIIDYCIRKFLSDRQLLEMINPKDISQVLAMWKKYVPDLSTDAELQKALYSLANSKGIPLDAFVNTLGLFIYSFSGMSLRDDAENINAKESMITGLGQYALAYMSSNTFSTIDGNIIGSLVTTQSITLPTIVADKANIKTMEVVKLSKAYNEDTKNLPRYMYRDSQGRIVFDENNSIVKKAKTLKNSSYVVFDLETCNPDNMSIDTNNPKYNESTRIVQLAYTVVKPNGERIRYSKYIVYDINGVSTEIVKTWKKGEEEVPNPTYEPHKQAMERGELISEKEAIVELLKVFKEYGIAVGHNISNFDLKILKGAIKRLGINLKEEGLEDLDLDNLEVIDTFNDLAIQIFPQGNNKLTDLYNREDNKFKRTAEEENEFVNPESGKVKGAHNADIDVDNNIRVASFLADRILNVSFDNSGIVDTSISDYTFVESNQNILKKDAQELDQALNIPENLTLSEIVFARTLKEHNAFKEVVNAYGVLPLSDSQKTFLDFIRNNQRYTVIDMEYAKYIVDNIDSILDSLGYENNLENLPQDDRDKAKGRNNALLLEKEGVIALYEKIKQAMESKDTHDPKHVLLDVFKGRNGRIYIANSLINPQSYKKLQRFFIIPENEISVYSTTIDENTVEFRNVALVVSQCFGIKATKDEQSNSIIVSEASRAANLTSRLLAITDKHVLYDLREKLLKTKGKVFVKEFCEKENLHGIFKEEDGELRVTKVSNSMQAGALMTFLIRRLETIDKFKGKEEEAKKRIRNKFKYIKVKGAQQEFIDLQKEINALNEQLDKREEDYNKIKKRIDKLHYEFHKENKIEEFKKVRNSLRDINDKLLAKKQQLEDTKRKLEIYKRSKDLERRHNREEINLEASIPTLEKEVSALQEAYDSALEGFDKRYKEYLNLSDQLSQKEDDKKDLKNIRDSKAKELHSKVVDFILDSKNKDLLEELFKGIEEYTDKEVKELHGFKAFLPYESDSKTSGVTLRILQSPLENMLLKFGRGLGIYTNENMKFDPINNQGRDPYVLAAEAYTKEFYDPSNNFMGDFEDLFSSDSANEVKERYFSPNRYCSKMSLELRRVIIKAFNKTMVEYLQKGKMRDFFKSPTMVFNYSAGKKSISNNISEEIIAEWRKAYARYMQLNEATRKLIDTYLEDKTKLSSEEINKINKLELSVVEFTGIELFKELSKYRPNTSTFKAGRYGVESTSKRSSDGKGHTTFVPSDSLYTDIMYNSFRDIFILRSISGSTEKVNLNEILNGTFGLIYGNSIYEALDKLFEFHESNAVMNSIGNFLAREFIKEYEKGLEQIKENNNGNIPVKDFWELIENIRHLFPTLSDILEDRLSTTGLLFLKQQIDIDKEGNNRVATYTKDGKTIETNPYIMKFVDAGLAANVLPIHMLDSFVCEFVQRMAFGGTWIFDAVMTDVLKAKDKQYQFNRAMFLVNAKYDVIEEFKGRLDNYLQYKYEEYLKIEKGSKKSFKDFRKEFTIELIGRKLSIKSERGDDLKSKKDRNISMERFYSHYFNLSKSTSFYYKHKEARKKAYGYYDKKSNKFIPPSITRIKNTDGDEASPNLPMKSLDGFDVAEADRNIENDSSYYPERDFTKVVNANLEMLDSDPSMNSLYIAMLANKGYTEVKEESKLEESFQEVAGEVFRFLGAKSYSLSHNRNDFTNLLFTLVPNSAMSTRVAMFDKLAELDRKDGKIPDSTHIAELKSIFQFFDKSLLEKLNIYMYENGLEGISNGYFDLTNTTIVLAGKNKNVKYTGSPKEIEIKRLVDKFVEMNSSLPEIYMHEQLHYPFEFMFSYVESSEAIDIFYKIVHLWNRAKQEFTVNDFLPSNYDSLSEEEKRAALYAAQTYYDYVFTADKKNIKRSISEFCAYSLSNKRVMDKLKQIDVVAKDKDETKTNLFTKLVSYIKAIFNVIWNNKTINESIKDSTKYIRGEVRVGHKEKVFDEMMYLFHEVNRIDAKYIRKLEDRNTAYTIANIIDSLGIKYDNLNEAVGKMLTFVFRCRDKGLLAADMDLIKLRNLATPIGFVKFLFETITNPSFRLKLRHALVDTYNIDYNGFLYRLLSDTVGPDNIGTFSTTMLHDYHSQRRIGEQQCKTMELVLRKQLKDAYGRDLTTEESTALYHILLKTDLSCLTTEYTTTGIYELLKNDKYLESEINATIEIIKNMLNSSEKLRFVNNQCLGLALLMNTGKVQQAQYINADQITKTILGIKSLKQIEPSYQHLSKFIDILTTMYAIRNLDSTKIGYKEAFTKLSKEGNEHFLKAHRQYVLDCKHETLNTVYIRAEHVIKGYTKPVIDYSSNIRIGLIDKATQEAMREKGFKLNTNFGFTNTIDNDENKKLGVYVCVWNLSEGRSGGAFSIAGIEDTYKQYRDNLVDIHSKGNTKISSMSIDEQNEYTNKELNKVTEKRNKLLNLYYKKDLSYETLEKISNGMMSQMDYKNDLQDYYLVADYDMKENFLKASTDGIEVFSTTYANEIRRINSTQINRELTKFLIGDMRTNMTIHHRHKALNIKYVRIEKNSENKHMREIWRTLPNSIKYKAESIEDGLWVREDWLLDLFGVRTMSLIETRLLKHTNIGVKKAIVNIEKGFKYVAHIAKHNIVFEMPKTLITNVICNYFMSVLEGNSPIKTLKYVIESIRDTNRWLDDNKLYTEYMLRQKQGEIFTDIELANMNTLKFRMSKNPINPLMEAGLFSTIIDNLDTVPVAVKDVQRKIDENTLIKKTPSAVKRILKNMWLTKDTSVYRMMYTFTQYSDFIFRAADYKIAMETKTKEKLYVYDSTTHQYAMNPKYYDKSKAVLRELKYRYIDYDLPSSSGEQYLNEIGLLNFTKFRKRFQWVLMNGIAKNPLTALSILGLQMGFGFNTPLDETLFSKPLWNNLYNPFNILLIALVPGGYHFVTNW